METKVVEANYKVLSNLEIGQKLYVKESGELVKDERWLQGLRRRRDGVSREDIKEPIRKTLVSKLEGDKGDVEQLVRRLKVVLYGTYPDFTGIQDMLNMLLGDLPDVLSQDTVTISEQTGVNYEVRGESELVVQKEVIFEQPHFQSKEDDSLTPLRRSVEDSVLEDSVLEDSVSEDSVGRRPGGFIVRLLGFFCIKY